MPVLPGALAPIPGAAANIGGAGYQDPGSTHFGGAGVEPTEPINLMGWDFVVTGAPGSHVTFHPSGVFMPDAYSPGTKAVPATITPVVGGDVFYDSATGFTSAESSPPRGTFTVFIAVPEPSAFLCMAVVACPLIMGRSRRRSRTASAA